MSARTSPRIVDWPSALRALRRRRGWTQAQLAEEVGCAPNTIYRYEAGRSLPIGLYRRALRELLEAANGEQGR